MEGGKYHLLLPGLPLHAHLPPVLPTTHAARVNTYGAESTCGDAYVHAVKRDARLHAAMHTHTRRCAHIRGDSSAQSRVAAGAAAGADSVRCGYRGVGIRSRRGGTRHAPLMAYRGACQCPLKGSRKGTRADVYKGMSRFIQGDESRFIQGDERRCTQGAMTMHDPHMRDPLYDHSRQARVYGKGQVA